MDGDVGEIRYSGTLRDIPTPPDSQTIRLTRWIRLDHMSVVGPSPLNRLARFHGGSSATRGTHGQHREQFELAVASRRRAVRDPGDV